ncbi:MAG: RNA polymerase sporulation sigma factor SigK [Clostridia bacterium]|nr:RNA polymerase sporulation sigma factor SigK [Clostridia bacterium]
MLEAILLLLKNLFAFTGLVGRQLPGSLPKEDEERLVGLLLKGDENARGELIEHNLRLVAHIAKKYRAPGRELDDLISIGSVGLIKAVNTYSPGRGRSLAAYIGRCVENEILMYVRSERKRRGEVSLDEPIGTDRDGNEITVGDVLGSDGESVTETAERTLRAQRVRDAVDACLKGRERSVIILRFGLDGGEPLKQREVAALLRISRSYVSRIETNALRQLERELKGMKE